MPKSQNLTYEQAAHIILLAKYPLLKNYNLTLRRMRGGVQITGDVANIPENDPRYVKGDVKAKYVQPPRKKLDLPPDFIRALEAVTKKESGSYTPPSMPDDAPEAPPMAPPMAPSFKMPREARIIEEGQQQMQQLYKPMAQRNILEELKDYKDGLEQIRNICPMLKRTYVRKPVNKSSDKIMKALERMRKADLKYVGY